MFFYSSLLFPLPFLSPSSPSFLLFFPFSQRLLFLSFLPRLFSFLPIFLPLPSAFSDPFSSSPSLLSPLSFPFFFFPSRIPSSISPIFSFFLSLFLPLPLSFPFSSYPLPFPAFLTPPVSCFLSYLPSFFPFLPASSDGLPLRLRLFLPLHAERLQNSPPLPNPRLSPRVLYLLSIYVCASQAGLWQPTVNEVRSVRKGGRKRKLGKKRTLGKKR